jgi:hypothetical protein
LAESICNGLTELSVSLRENEDVADASLKRQLEAVTALLETPRMEIAVESPEDAEDVRILAIHTRAISEELADEDLNAPREVVDRAKKALARSLIVLDGAA